MGSIGTVMQNIVGTGPLQQTQRELVSALQDLADAKAEAYNQQLDKLLQDAGTGQDKTVPVSSILRRNREVHAYSSTSQANILATVNQIANAFLKHDGDSVIQAVTATLSTGLAAFLGTSSGQSRSYEEYFVYCDGTMIYRVDVFAWHQDVSATGLSQQLSSVAAFAYTLSTVDVSKITWPAFVGILGYQMSVMPMNQAEKQALRDRMQQTWAFLTNEQGVQGFAPAPTEDLSLERGDATGYRLPLDRSAQARGERPIELPADARPIDTRGLGSDAHRV